MLWVSAVSFGVAWWLGLYLVARDAGKPVLRRAGAGLLAYAAAVLGGQLLGGDDRFDGLRAVLVCVPAIVWSGVFVRLLPEELADRADRWWRFGLLPACAVVAVPAVVGIDAAAYALCALAVLALFGSLLAMIRHRSVLLAGSRGGTVAGLFTVGALMFGLSATLILIGLDVLPANLLLSAVAIDLVFLGLGIAVLDAFEEGEALRADMVRSLLVSAGTAVVFGGQAGVAIVLVGERTALQALLFGTTAAAIALQVLYVPLQGAIDRIAFASAPRLREARDELRTAAEALPRKRGADGLTGPEAATGLAALDEAEFARLTRRALSHYADLGKLVSSPLIDLPAIDARLADRETIGPLDRAAELKTLLTESIAALKPRTGAEFGTSEEWRHYNAVYFYYVVGIRPYSVRTKRTDLDPVSRKALSWFVDQVPERTLHNWQNSAARMIAAQLRSGFGSMSK
ncbi:hypothetical protein HLB23_23015 [Nocardia uniformis]|uniref:Uncharacterized protein n=1 Tax=Nocardia uniformis TaxID=53432 RepID=A0A849C4J0_9NOCA|nr:hypothetical protein [Nocardia uniformis]NNH72698.1 hypothetical protein [Nocardia uniformis]